MKRYIERIWELMNDAETKHNVPLYDETLPKGINYDQLRVLSGRVYAYLKARGRGFRHRGGDACSRANRLYPQGL